ncbi:DUF6910 family protein [Nocardioides solisilvae]|uniref:DUF6910 family protein n=1 Tax=Nocardioides solisilvae TaxID=1542435 RepID=UPI0013A543FF|nr:hypothetical protein [Nocardioides solisilvae]
MRVEIEHVAHLRFADGAPVRAASAVAPWGDGFVVVQDDGTHGARFADATDTSEAAVTSGVAVRLLPTTQGHERFDTDDLKHLKPDLEAACPVEVEGGPGVLLLGSGASAARTRWSLLRPGDGPDARRWSDARSLAVEMAPLYEVVASVLGAQAGGLNLEGAHVVGDRLRWYQRGLPSAGLPSGSVDLDLAAALEAVLGRRRPEDVPVADPHFYRVADLDDVPLAITDVALLPGGTVIVSSAAEDSPDPQHDGPVVGSALAHLEGPAALDVVRLPEVDGEVPKVEGLMLLDASPHGARLLAVADADDPGTPSLALWLDVSL